MKTLLIKFVFITFISLFFLPACNSDDDNASNNDSKSKIEDNVEMGTWRITKYIDSGKDELNHFIGYNFTFGSNNVLTASNSTSSYTGTWSITDSNSDDDSQGDLDFNIFFAAPPNFEDLSDDWHFISQMSTKIELIDVSGGNGGTDYLTFEKN